MSEICLAILLIEKQKSHILSEEQCHRYYKQKFLGTWVHLQLATLLLSSSRSSEQTGFLTLFLYCLS